MIIDMVNLCKYEYHEDWVTESNITERIVIKECGLSLSDADLTTLFYS